MGSKHSKAKLIKVQRSNSKKRSFKACFKNRNEYWCQFHKKMADIPEDLLGAADTASKMVDDILMEYQVNNEVCRAFHLTKKLDKLYEEIMLMKAGRVLVPQEEEALKNLHEKVLNNEALQEIREQNINEKLYNEEINVLPEFDAYFMPSKAKTRLPPWKINVRDIATLLKEIPMLPEMNGKLRMPSYFPSTSSGGIPPSLRAFSSINPMSRTTTVDNASTAAMVEEIDRQGIDNIPILPELSNRAMTKRVSKIEKDFLREQIDSLFEKMQEEFKEQKIDIAHDLLKQIKELIKKGEFDEWVDFYINSRVDYKILMDDIEAFYKELVRVIAELEDEEGYSLDKARDDVLVKYKKYPKGRAALKFDAVIDIPIFELITLLQEPERYTSWSPYCADAKEITKLGRAGNVVWMKWDLPKPISAREGLMMGIGFNRMDVNGSVLVMSRTVDNDANIINRYDLPTQKSKNPRMDIEFSGVQLVPLSKNRTQFKFVVLSDPKVKLIPASLISWIARRGAGDMFDKLMAAARNIKGASMEESIKKNKEFYDWLQKLVDEHLGDKNKETA